MFRQVAIIVLISAAFLLEVFLLRSSPAGAILALAVPLLAAACLLWWYIRYLHQRKQDEIALRDKGTRPICCFPVSPKDWRKPDPFLYDQYYLKSLGFEVTFDNPDISIYSNGYLVDGDLQPDTEYEIVARIWNASFQAPAFNVLIEFYIRHFGIGPVDRLIGTDVIPVIQVRGLPPGFARAKWKPDAAGHYCIVVRVYCVDDANPNNNQGQKNVDVGRWSPGELAQLDVRIANGEDQPIALQLIANQYELPAAGDAGERRAQLWGGGSGRIQRSQDRMGDVAFRPFRKILVEEALKRSGSGRFPLPADAEVALPPHPVAIPARQEVVVTVRLRVPRDLGAPEHLRGYPLTILAMTQDETLYGGVTFLLRPR